MSLIHIGSASHIGKQDGWLQKRKLDLDLNYFETDVELVTGCVEVFEEQVIHHINRNVNKMKKNS